MMRLTSAAAVALAGVLVLSGCQGPEPDSTVAPSSPTEESQTQSGGDIELDADLWPLTGSPLNGGASSAPALAAKIDNHPLARPQVGLDAADIVFEQLVEGGYTRFLAIWHSSVPAEIGPVRSIRPMDPDIVSPFGGIIAYVGGQQRFIEAMLDAPVASAIHGQSDVADFFYRTSDKVIPHNVIARAPELVGYFADRSSPPPQFNYSTGLAESSAAERGEELSSLNVFFSRISDPIWQWDEQQGVFTRLQNSNLAPHLSSSGAQISAVNVVVLQVRIEVIQDVPTTQLIGEGEGVIATGGKVLPIRWSKQAPDRPIELSDASGARVLLAPGQTWVELIPSELSEGVPAGSISWQ